MSIKSITYKKRGMDAAVNYRVGEGRAGAYISEIYLESKELPMPHWIASFVYTDKEIFNTILPASEIERLEYSEVGV